MKIQYSWKNRHEEEHCRARDRVRERVRKTESRNRTTEQENTNQPNDGTNNAKSLHADKSIWIWYESAVNKIKLKI